MSFNNTAADKHIWPLRNWKSYFHFYKKETYIIDRICILGEVQLAQLYL